MADLSTRDGRSLSGPLGEGGRLGVALSWKTTQLTDFVVAHVRPAKRRKGERGEGEERVLSVHSWIAWRSKRRITRTREGGGRRREKYWPRQAVSGLADIPAASRRPL